MDGFGYRLDASALDVERAGEQSPSRFVRELTRYRYQALGGLFFGVLLPAFIRSFLEPNGVLARSYDNSLIGSLCAVSFGFLIYRKMTAIPGANAITKVIPAFMTSYATVAMFFLICRLDYSRSFLLISIAFAVLWFGFIQQLVAKMRRPKFGYVGDPASLRHAGEASVHFEIMKTTGQASLSPRLPLVVDFQSDVLSRDWENYLSSAVVAGRPVFDSEVFFESTEGRVRIFNLARHAIGQTPSDSIYVPAKRYIDLGVSILALAILSPLMLLIASLIRIDSKGPVFFIQNRIGHRGLPFKMIKFRSMTHGNSNDDRLADTTADHDPRITGVGRFIRTSRLDELPQLLNVALGQMSLIGPRPETIKLSKHYEENIPNYRYRHVVRPGITGWAQVRQGHVSNVDDVGEKLEYDFFYVKNISIWLDLLIVLKTAKVMLTGFGAK